VCVIWNSRVKTRLSLSRLNNSQAVQKKSAADSLCMQNKSGAQFSSFLTKPINRKFVSLLVLLREECISAGDNWIEAESGGKREMGGAGGPKNAICEQQEGPTPQQPPPPPPSQQQQIALYYIYRPPALGWYTSTAASAHSRLSS